MGGVSPIVDFDRLFMSEAVIKGSEETELFQRSFSFSRENR